MTGLLEVLRAVTALVCRQPVPRLTPRAASFVSLPTLPSPTPSRPSLIYLCSPLPPPRALLSLVQARSLPIPGILLTLGDRVSVRRAPWSSPKGREGEKGKWLFVSPEEWALRTQKRGASGFLIPSKALGREAGSRASCNSCFPQAGARGAPTVCPCCRSDTSPEEPRAAG